MIAHFAPGVLTNFGHGLVSRRGAFTGPALKRATEMHGLMEGAVRSGESAAEQVMNAEA
jgi:monoamine oxidase